MRLVVVVVICGLLGCHQRAPSEPGQLTEDFEELGPPPPHRGPRVFAGSTNLKCGVERWSVKVGLDPDAGTVAMTPMENNIATLIALSPPAQLDSATARTGPVETTTYLLRDVLLTDYKLESDNDFHMVVSDGSNHMIVEVPNPGCMGDSVWIDMVTKARNVVVQQLNPTSTFQTANQTISVIGVGFFDVRHSTPQRGVAPNGIELHSVLKVCFGAGCSPG